MNNVAEGARESAQKKRKFQCVLQRSGRSGLPRPKEKVGRRIGVRIKVDELRRWVERLSGRLVVFKVKTIFADNGAAGGAFEVEIDAVVVVLAADRRQAFEALHVARGFSIRGILDEWGAIGTGVDEQ